MKLQVNSLVDDASTKTYINVDVTAELGLQGCLQKVNVSVLNGNVETFETYINLWSVLLKAGMEKFTQK